MTRSSETDFAINAVFSTQTHVLRPGAPFPKLIGNKETGLPNCIVCGMCQRACPSGCITVAGEKPEGAKKKVLTKYILDFTKCSLCGSCVESCNFNAIRYSHDYNLASTSKEDYIFDLVKRLEEKS